MHFSNRSNSVIYLFTYVRCITQSLFVSSMRTSVACIPMRNIVFFCHVIIVRFNPANKHGVQMRNIVFFNHAILESLFVSNMQTAFFQLLCNRCSFQTCEQAWHADEKPYFRSCAISVREQSANSVFL